MEDPVWIRAEELPRHPGRAAKTSPRSGHPPGCTGDMRDMEGQPGLVPSPGEGGIPTGKLRTSPFPLQPFLQTSPAQLEEAA